MHAGGQGDCRGDTPKEPQEAGVQMRLAGARKLHLRPPARPLHATATQSGTVASCVPEANAHAMEGGTTA